MENLRKQEISHRLVARWRKHGERCWRRNSPAKLFCSNWTCGRLFPEQVMSHSVPRQQSVPDAARSASPSTPPADRPLPDFQPHTPSPYSPIDREIERSERASAALAATRALTRASFTDSELAAENVAGSAVDDHDIDTSGWIRTEYAALDQAARSPQAAAPPRNLVGGTFNPGIASLQGRAFPNASIAHTPIKTRSGAEARFLRESRQAPRPERAVGGVARSELSLSASTAHYDKPAVIPMLAPATAPAGARSPARVAARTPAGARAVEPVKFLFAVGLGAIVVLMAGGVAWKAGLLSRTTPSNAALITPEVAARAEAARVQSAAQQEIPITPAAGVPTRRSDAEVDAALAAAARAAAVPAASVRAAGPSRVTRALPPPTPLAAAPANASTAVQHAPAHKESVAEAIANAQARADRFLAPDASAPATPEARQAP
jgi:hypothetical protein